MTVLTHADRAEFDAGLPQRVGPRAQQLLHLLGPRIGGEIQVTAQAAQQRVAHAAADQVQVVARVSEYLAEFTQHRAVPVQCNLRGGQPFGVSCAFLAGIGHVR